MRMLVLRDGDQIRLMTRNRNEVSDPYPELVEALAAQSAGEFIADGKVVAFDGNVISFSCLQDRMPITDRNKARASGIMVHLYLFDLLHFAGHDLTKLPVRRRKSLLRRALGFDNPLRFTPHRNTEGEALFERACARSSCAGLLHYPRARYSIASIFRCQWASTSIWNAIMAENASVIAVAAEPLSTFSRASGKSSENTIQIMAPAARPRPTGRNGRNVSTKR